MVPQLPSTVKKNVSMVSNIAYDEESKSHSLDQWHPTQPSTIQAMNRCNSISEVEELILYSGIIVEMTMTKVGSKDRLAL